MSVNHYDLVVYICRAQPPHIAHGKTVLTGLQHSNNVVVVFGSAHRPVTPENPFRAVERMQLMTQMMEELGVKNVSKCVHYKYVEDSMYDDDEWVLDVQKNVDEQKAKLGLPKDASVALIGYEKDQTSYYLDKFPQWTLIPMPRITNDDKQINATDIRVAMFTAIKQQSDEYLETIKPFVTPGVFHMLNDWCQTPDALNVTEDYFFTEQYKAMWSNTPYPVQFLTVDAVVIHSGHILLVQRKAAPGKDLWALPGGFVNPDERLMDAAIRELREETKLKLPVPVLRGSVRGDHYFDHPRRSARGRTLTHAFKFVFPSGELPKVKGSDDARKAKWFSLSEALSMGPMLFEDHLDIIKYFL